MSRWTRSAVVVLAAALAGCTAAPAPPAPTAAPPAGVATNPGPYDSGPVAAPTAGARLGAWVKPRVWGQDGRRAAITGYEESLNTATAVRHVRWSLKCLW